MLHQKDSQNLPFSFSRISVDKWFQWLFNVNPIVHYAIIFGYSFLALFWVLIAGIWISVFHRLPWLLSLYMSIEEQSVSKSVKYRRNFQERWMLDKLGLQLPNTLRVDLKEYPQDYTASHLIHSYVEVQDLKIHYVSLEQTSTKPLLLLIHGFPESWYSWRHQLAPFSAKYNAIAIDLPGYGDSSKPSQKSAYTEASLTKLVSGIIKALGYSKASIIGHDWGGIVAWSFAEIFPSQVEQLVLINTLNSRQFKQAMTLSQLRKAYYMFFQQIPILPELLTKLDSCLWIREIFRVHSSTTSVNEMDVYRRNYLEDKSSVSSALMYYRSLFQGGWGYVGENARKLTVPTLGKEDSVIEPKVCLESLSKASAKISLEIIEGAGHFPHQDQPQIVNKIILEWSKTC